MIEHALTLEMVQLIKSKKLPSDYIEADGKYSKKYLGQLIRKDGSYYNRLERRKYYSKLEVGHPAKTPVHIARWAVQEFTNPGDWVLDPTAGVGTTLVEALLQRRNAVGIELEFLDAMKANIKMNNPFDMKYRIVRGDARNIKEWIKDLKFRLIVNNPPYFGDIRQKGLAEKKKGKWDNKTVGYDSRFANLAFLRENSKYWGDLGSIYKQCVDRLLVGGTFVVGTKDMMRDRKPTLLHKKIGDLLSTMLQYQGMVLLKHYPGTLHTHTYEKKFGAIPPTYQTILIFRKGVK
jgi:DNA modification methylase